MDWQKDGQMEMMDGQGDTNIPPRVELGYNTPLCIKLHFSGFFNRDTDTENTFLSNRKQTQNYFV